MTAWPEVTPLPTGWLAAAQRGGRPMTARISYRHQVAVMTRGVIVERQAGSARSREHVAGKVEGAALAYADLHGAQPATELLFALADTGCRVSLGADFGRSLDAYPAPPAADAAAAEVWGRRIMWLCVGLLLRGPLDETAGVLF